VDKSGDEAVTAEVEKRLDDIFGADDDDNTAFLENGPLSQDSPLRNLKGVVLSIDWEITDDIMGSFLDEIERLKETFSAEKIPLLFLQLLGSVGKYIRNQKARAHPNSIRVLNSVYNSFEKVLLEKEMPEAEKRKWLYGEVNRFKQLKQDIAQGRAEAPKSPAEPVEAPPIEEAVPEIPAATAPEEAVPETPVATGPEVVEPSSDAMPPQEVFTEALEDLKKVLKTEFQGLKTELQELRKELRLWREAR